MSSPGNRPKGQIPRPTWRKDKQVFEGKITVGRHNGKLLRKSVYGKTEQEYWRKANEFIGLSPIALLANIHKVTLERWIKKYIEHKTPDVRPASLDKYDQFSGYIVPSLGGLLIGEVRSAHLHTLFTSLAVRGLSPSTRQQVYHFLKDALRFAWKQDVIPFNPMDKVDRPKGGTVRDSEAWAPSDVLKVLKAAESTRWYGPIAFALSTGLRPGELYALRWADIKGDLVEVKRTLLHSGHAPVFGKPKTASSHRVFYIDTETLALLEQYRYVIEEEKAKAKKRWIEYGLVFPSSVGAPINTSNFRRALQEIAVEAGVPYRSPHELRHTHITLLRRLADVKLVSRKAGHADTAITDKIYNHPRHEDLRTVAIPLSQLLKAEGGDDT